MLTKKIMIMTGWSPWQISRIMRLTNMNLKQLYDCLKAQKRMDDDAHISH